jgi:hypothetical protein
MLYSNMYIFGSIILIISDIVILKILFSERDNMNNVYLILINIIRYIKEDLVINNYIVDLSNL